MDLVELSEPNRVRFQKEGVKIDLGGIAKGLAADLAVDKLKAHGKKAGLVNAGGDISLFGGKWRVGIQNPFEESEMLSCVVLLDEGAIVTSGSYRRGYMIDGKRYSHIVDPRTGETAEPFASVTVIAPDAASADGLATAISVMGIKNGTELAESLEGTECLLIPQNAEKEMRMTSGFNKHLEWENCNAR